MVLSQRSAHSSEHTEPSVFYCVECHQAALLYLRQTVEAVKWGQAPLTERPPQLLPQQVKTCVFVHVGGVGACMCVLLIYPCTIIEEKNLSSWVNY